MKFPKSMHAEGWAHHFEDGATPPTTKVAAPRRAGSVKAGAKPVSAHTPLHLAPAASGPAVRLTAPAVPGACAPVAVAAAATHPASSVAPWVVGAGIGVAMIASVVLMSRSMSPSEMATPVVVGQVLPPPPVGPEAQLQAAPPSAGVAVMEPEPVPAATAVAEAPAALKPAPADSRTTPAVASLQAPAARTLAAPEVLAQAELRPLAAMPVPAPAPEAPLAVPPAAAPQASLPLAALPPAASPVDPADAGITVQVRQALAGDAALAVLPIVVSTEHGVVTLLGQAPDAQARERATVVASAADGVKAVDNRLTLPPTA